jgi:hypothetical protein
MVKKTATRANMRLGQLPSNKATPIASSAWLVGRVKPQVRHAGVSKTLPPRANMDALLFLWAVAIGVVLLIGHFF